jgi:hypothetical protein
LEDLLQTLFKSEFSLAKCEIKPSKKLQATLKEGGLALAALSGVAQINRILIESFHWAKAMEQYALKILKSCWNNKFTFYLETFGGQKSNLYLNVVHIFNPSVN